MNKLSNVSFVGGKFFVIMAHSVPVRSKMKSWKCLSCDGFGCGSDSTLPD